MSLSLKYIAHSYKWRVGQMSASLHFLPVPEEIIYSFSVYFVIVQTWSIYHSLDKKVWLWNMSLPVKESNSVPDMDFFCYTFIFLSDVELSRIELPKLTPSILTEILIISFVLFDQFYFCMHQTIRLDFFKSLSLS